MQCSLQLYNTQLTCSLELPKEVSRFQLVRSYLKSGYFVVLYNLGAPTCGLKKKIKIKKYIYVSYATNFYITLINQFFYFLQLQMTTYCTATGPRLTLL